MMIFRTSIIGTPKGTLLSKMVQKVKTMATVPTTKISHITIILYETKITDLKVSLANHLAPSP